MDISLNGYRTIDEDTQVTFFSLTHEGVTYRWHGNTPVLTGEDLEEYLSAHKEEYLSGIYRKMYQEADVVPLDGETEIEAWTRWIAGGCRNTGEVVTMGEDGPVTETVEEVIPLTPWEDTHPVTESEVTWVE